MGYKPTAIAILGLVLFVSMVSYPISVTAQPDTTEMSSPTGQPTSQRPRCPIGGDCRPCGKKGDQTNTGTSSPNIKTHALTEAQTSLLRLVATRSDDFRQLLRELREDNYEALMEQARGYSMTIGRGTDGKTTYILSIPLSLEASLPDDIKFVSGSAIFSLDDSGLSSNLALSDLKVGYIDMLTSYAVKDGQVRKGSTTVPDEFFGCQFVDWWGVACVVAGYFSDFVECGICAVSISMSWFPLFWPIDVVACGMCFAAIFGIFPPWEDFCVWCNDPYNVQFSGPTYGYTYSSYTYTASAKSQHWIAPRQLSYQFVWGDGTSTSSSWLNSGTTYSASHAWSSAGTYSVHVHVVDTSGYWKDSSAITVTIATSDDGGGCPVVAPWNGSDFVVDNNILPLSENHVNSSIDVRDYYQLQVPMQLYGTSYAIRLQENEHEMDYFNEISLSAVYHDPSVNLAITPDGQILTYSKPDGPKVAADMPTANIANLVSSPDDGQYFQGALDRPLYLSFKGVEHPEYAKLVIREDIFYKYYSSHVSVLGRDRQWHDIGVIEPRHNWYTSGLDISRYAPRDGSDVIVKLTFTGNDKIDWVSIDDSPPAQVTVKQLELTGAKDQNGGIVTAALERVDDDYVVISPGQYATLYFEFQTVPPGMTQDFVLSAVGRYVHLEAS